MNGEDLQRRRKALGLSQAQLAKALDLSVRTLQNWESAHRKVPLVTGRWLDVQLCRLERQQVHRGRKGE
jgi:transcriptional regulator with XRE-family HTH domain